MWNMGRSDKRVKSKTKLIPPSVSDSELLTEDSFVKMLHVEQKRTERSRRRFILMLLDCRVILTSKNSPNFSDFYTIYFIKNDQELTELQSAYTKYA